jgi:hypothetical protein
MMLPENPPRNGEGNQQSWWRGPTVIAAETWAPSVSPSGCHLPVPGRS